jgi:hypothetical protein
MDIKFSVETTNGKVWTATCADPVLEVTNSDIVTVCKDMAKMIEEWFVETFKTDRTVLVEVPIIKAKVTASVSVRPETPLTDFTEPVKIQNHIQLTPDEVRGPCIYLSDGKGVLPVGACEAYSDDPADTPGLQIDADGACKGKFNKCNYYKSTGTLSLPKGDPEVTMDDSDVILSDDPALNDIDGYE